MWSVKNEQMLEKFYKFYLFVATWVAFSSFLCFSLLETTAINVKSLQRPLGLSLKDIISLVCS